MKHVLTATLSIALCVGAIAVLNRTQLGKQILGTA